MPDYSVSGFDWSLVTRPSGLTSASKVISGVELCYRFNGQEGMGFHSVDAGLCCFAACMPGDAVDCRYSLTQIISHLSRGGYGATQSITIADTTESKLYPLRKDACRRRPVVGVKHVFCILATSNLAVGRVTPISCARSGSLRP